MLWTIFLACLSLFKLIKFTECMTFYWVTCFLILGEEIFFYLKKDKHLPFSKEKKLFKTFNAVVFYLHSVIKKNQ